MHRRHFLIGLGAFAAIRTSVRAQQVMFRTQTFDLGDQGALYRVPLDVGNGRRVFCTAAVLPRQSFSAGIVPVSKDDAALTAVQDVARKDGATVAINGGFFNGAFAPDGLLIEDGTRVGNKRADWRGYVTIDALGNASVTAKPNLHTARYGVQGNPLIIEPGGKIRIVRDDRQYARRSVIAQSGDVIVAMVTTPASLFELAYALIERPDALYVNRIDAALNLTGAATTSFYAKLADGHEITIAADWPNREVITFTRRSSA